MNVGMLLDNVRLVIAAELGRRLNDVQEDSNLIEDLDVDEIARLSIFTEIEDAFSVKIPDSLWPTLQTPAEIAEAVRERL